MSEQAESNDVIYMDEMRADDALAATDGTHPIIDDAMEAYLTELLDEESAKLGADIAGVDAVPDIVLKDYDSEDDDLPPDLVEDTIVPSSKTNDVVEETAPQLVEKDNNTQISNNKPAMDDDGFTIVGKNGKPIKNNNKNKKNNNNKSQQQQNNNNKPNNKNNNNNKSQQQQNNNNTRSASSQAPQVYRATAAEKREKLPGDNRFPFCFVCARCHDFGECDE